MPSLLFFYVIDFIRYSELGVLRVAGKMTIFVKSLPFFVNKKK